MSDPIMQALDKLEANIKAMSEKAAGEISTIGKVSQDTKNALENIGIEQRVFADRLLKMEQQATAQGEINAIAGFGEQLIKSAGYADFTARQAKGRFSMELKNTVTNAVANTFSERKPGIVEGAFREFTVEDLLTSIPTNSNAVDWLRENTFTNAAAETAEGVQKPQSSITFSPATMPVTNVAHWIKITRQLAMDNAALAAYINRRMIYGVNLRVENQLVAGNGVAPNLNGFTNAGNFTAHGYTGASIAALGLLNNRIDLIGLMIGDCAIVDYKASGIILNTADWWRIRLAKDGQGQYLLGGPGVNVTPTLFGLPVAASNAMQVDNVLVGDLRMAATLHNREGVVVDMFDQDENNAQLNLITIRAERRLALTVEKPAAMRYGDLTPA